MKRILSIMLIAVLTIATVNAQNRRTRRSHKEKVTSAASQYRKASPIEGTWYKTRTNYITFRADSTTDYGGLTMKYEYLADEGQIIISKPDGSERQVLIILKLTSDQLILSADGTTFATYNKQCPPQPVNGISLSQSSVQLRKNETAEIVASIYPADADNKEVFWTSSNDSVVTVEGGMIRAVNFGKAIITAESGEDYKIFASCEVEVVGQVTSIELSQNHLMLKPNEFKQLKATVFPADADNPKYSWSSSNEDVVQVTPQGRVLAMGNGFATITSTALDGSGVSAKCDVFVGIDIVPFSVNGVDFEMVKVEGGTFSMGATFEQGNDAYENEMPVHEVTLSSYYIGKVEVTQSLWQALMGNNPSEFKGDDHPVECVSWNDCQAFISRLNAVTGRYFRLPTEAEWEFAARGGRNSRGYKYSGSNDIDDVAWYSYNSGSIVHPVGTKYPNELGVYDMSGNVREWCSDWDDDYSSRSQTNPKGPDSGNVRVCRGGSWHYSAEQCRSSFRDDFGPDFSDYNLGLRLALSSETQVVPAPKVSNKNYTSRSVTTDDYEAQQAAERAAAAKKAKEEAAKKAAEKKAKEEAAKKAKEEADKKSKKDKDDDSKSSKNDKKAKADTPSTHSVKEGESLERIARKNGVTTQELKKANPNLKSDVIHPGDKLNVPKSSKKSADKKDTKSNDDKSSKKDTKSKSKKK